MAVKGGGDVDETFAEINITPLTDCILVLLIIFMIAATAIAQTGFNIKLPKVASKEETPPAQIDISVTSAGDIYVGAHKVKLNVLYPYLRNLASSKHTNRVVIKGDQDVQYGIVIRVMDASKRAGLSSIALATQREE